MPNSNISLSKDKNQSDTQNIIAVGRFDDSRKGIEYLLLAFAKVLKKCPKSKLTIVGGIDFQLRNSITGESINELITRLKIPDENLVLAGWVSDVEKYYEEANVHVLPSFYEGFGLVLLEAASYGMPSVVFDKNGYEDIIDDGSTGFIVESGNVIAMAEKIILLLSDSTVMTNMQKKLPQMLERFNKDVISNRWNSLIQAVLTKENTVLNEYLKKEFMIEISNPDKWIHDIISEYEAVLGRLWKYSVSQQACPSAHMEYSIIVPDLIKETSSLFANLHSVYGSMLEHSKANQSKLKIIQSNIQALYSGLPGQSQSLLIEENTTNVSSAAPTGIKFRIKRCCATVARKLYKPFRRIATDMGLKPFIKSTSIYKKLRVRGVIEKLNQ
ncbi:MAG: glycosyltransferase [Defluviitaleaceae bacterium]|nr:glycosyltransferase [Defluviitaleaceae bacterium]